MAKKVKQLNYTKAVAHIKSSTNNTIITITSVEGDTIASSSAGCCGFKGPKRGTSFAGGKVSMTVGQLARDLGIKELDIVVQGPGMGRDAAIRALADQNFTIHSITDNTPLPHNGTRAPKRRH